MTNSAEAAVHNVACLNSTALRNHDRCWKQYASARTAAVAVDLFTIRCHSHLMCTVSQCCLRHKARITSTAASSFIIRLYDDYMTSAKL
eukprot:12570-Heterococcus_DN1.PRE.2